MFKLTIITINYNNIEGLKRTVESVLSQTWSEFEYILIDGGSSDGSREYIEDQKEKFNYWISESDNGVYNAMNKGILRSKGEYILFLNSGDCFYNSNVLEKNITHLDGTEIIYFDFVIRDKENLTRMLQPSKLSFDFFYNRTLNHQSVLHKRSLFKNYGLYDETLQIVSDWKFYILALCKFNVSFKKINEVFTIYELGGMSSTLRNKLEEEKEMVLNSEFPMFLEGYKNQKRYELLSDLHQNSRLLKTLRFLKLVKNI